MTPQTEFDNPPGGHIGLLTYDSVTKKWYAVLGDSGGRIQIEVTTIALPTGAATAAKQLADGHNVTVDNVSLAVTGAFYPETQPVSGAFYPGTQPVSGAFYPETQPVSVASLPLPSGAATQSTLASLLTSLQSLQNIVGALADVNVDELRVNVIAELPAGTKNIGDVDVATMPTTTVQATGGDKIWAYEDTVVESLINNNCSTGTNSLYGTAVPSGKVDVITQVMAVYIGTPPTRMLVWGDVSGILVVVQDEESVESEVHYTKNVHIVIDAGDKMGGQVQDATATDFFEIRYSGYRMDAP